MKQFILLMALIFTVHTGCKDLIDDMLDAKNNKDDSPAGSIVPVGEEDETDGSLPASLREGLVAEYLFNGDAKDTSGNENHGQLGDATEGDAAEPTKTTDRFGNADSAYSFDGGDWVISPYGKDGEWNFRDTWTVSYWVKDTYSGEYASDQNTHWSIYGTNGSYSHSRIVVSKSNNSIWHIGYVKSDIGYQNTAYLSDLFYDNSIENDNWVHVTTVCTGGTSPRYKIYINSTDYTSELIYDYQDDNIQSIQTDDYFSIGAQYRHGNPGFHFNGSIDDVRIYNRALSEDEIFALYREGNYITRDGLVAEYLFNGNADDSSGNNNHGQLGSSSGADASDPSETTDRFGKSSRAYDFDGMNDYATLPSGIIQSTEYNYSISGWVYMESESYNPIISDQSNPDAKYRLYFSTNTNPTYQFSLASYNNGVDAIQTTYTSNYGKWVHFTLLIDYNTQI